MVDLHYKTYSPGLISASIKFNGMTYHVPIDVRDNHATALFQIEAPIYATLDNPNPGDLYLLEVNLDGQTQRFHVGLSQDLRVSHYPI